MQRKTIVLGGVALGVLVLAHHVSSSKPDAAAAPARTIPTRTAHIAPPATRTMRTAAIEVAIDPDAEAPAEDDAADEAAARAEEAADREAEHVAELEDRLGEAGALRGRVSDARTGEQLAGVTVIAQAGSTTTAAITDGDGYYEIVTAPGAYALTFYYLQTELRHDDVAVAAGHITPAYERMDVQAVPPPPPPVIDPEPGITIDTNYVKNIPVGRTFEDVLGSAPDSTGDSTGVTFSGGTYLENEYIVVE